MMKVICEDSIFLLPEDNQMNILSRNCQKKLIECFEMYFNKKKKNYCKIYDCEGKEINNKEVSFIYFPYRIGVEQNFIFKPKSFLNTELTEFIKENPLQFTSFENIRENLKECMTDKGMYQIRKILGNQIDQSIDLKLQNFEIEQLLSMLEINTEKLTLSDQYKILYNLLIFENRNKYSIVYIDFPIHEQDLKWLKSYMRENIFLLINNDCLQCDITESIKAFSMILLSDKDYMEKQEYDIREFNVISYLQNEYIMQHMDQQTEKNIRLFKEFEDINTTFYLLFSDFTTPNLL